MIVRRHKHILFLSQRGYPNKKNVPQLNKIFKVILHQFWVKIFFPENSIWNTAVVDKFLFPVKFHVKNSIENFIIMLFIGNGKN
jgi:hypothetical protein